MADRPDLTDVAGSANLKPTTYNANNEELASSYDQLLGRGGVGEDNNSMTADLDMDSNTLRNMRDAVSSNEPVTKSQLDAASPFNGGTSANVEYNQGGTDAITRTVEERLQDHVTSDDFGGDIQSALDHLDSVGGGTLEVVDGMHSASQQLRLYENITLVLNPNATIRRDFNTSPTGAGLLGVTGTPDNISILGSGTLDCNGTNFTTSANIFGGAGFNKLRIIGPTFLNVPDAHALDFADSDDILVTNCKFLGFANKSGTREFSEAIQLDPDISRGGNDNTNIRVLNNEFGDNPDNADIDMVAWPVAMGNHATVDGKFNRGIKFHLNTVNDAEFAGVRLLNFIDVDISNNTFNRCVKGVLFDFHKLAGIGYDACSNVGILDNTFSEMLGASVINGTTGFTTANGNAKHSGTTIDGNTIKGSGTQAALDLAWQQNITLGINNIREVDRGLHIRFCSQFTSTGLQVITTDENAIFISEGIETDFAGTGLTSDINIQGGFLKDLGFRGIHLSCAAERVTFKGVVITDPDRDATGREGIKVDAAPDDVTIKGCDVSQDGTITADYGISVTSGTNIKIRDNDVFDGVIRSYNITAASSRIDIEDTGTPEGVFTAGIGSVYRRKDGAAGTSFYVKESETTNTVWAAK